MYDNQTSRSDKRKQRETLAVLRQMKRSNNFIDQWDLIPCGLQAVRYTAKHPHVWISSAIAVNLHPKHRIPFDEWCKKIAPFMNAADSFDLVLKDNIDPYLLLPALWQAMTPEDKRKAMSIYVNHGKSWSVECIQDMMDGLVIKFSDVKAVQTGLWHAIENPSHFDRGMEDEEISQSNSAPVEVANIEQARKKATSGLKSYELKPEGMSGTELLDHAISYRLREYAKKKDQVSFHIVLINYTRHNITQ